MSTKRLETESSHDIFDKSLDFELSDEEPEVETKVEAQPFLKASESTSSLLAEKKSLEDELQQIELELARLEWALWFYISSD